VAWRPPVAAVPRPWATSLIVGPLAGITVVSIEQAVAAPFATRQLADLGARVIKVERPGAGDFARGYDKAVFGQSSYFVWLNRSKESLALNLQDARGKAILARLLVGADVFVQNLVPGAADRLGLSTAELTLDRPNLVVCNVSGYGRDGPWGDRKAYDLLVQCETGLVSLTGNDDVLAKVGISIADIAAGMYAFSGVLASLYGRATGGTARAVDVSLFDALGEWMGQPAYYTMYSGEQPRRVGIEHATIAPYGPFSTADGGTVVVGIQNEPEWARFCEVGLGDANLAHDPRFSDNSARVTNRADLNTMIGDRLGRLDTPAAQRLLNEIGVANAQVNSVAEFLEHPSLVGRDRWREVVTPHGPIRALLPPTVLDGMEARMDPVPAVGEHTEPILLSLGYTVDEIDDLCRDRVVTRAGAPTNATQM
jgi:crotonobetainyl-CoA:carnitine CoA-transferase CaiB-like acyl-CoA transferase